ncbi:MAG: histidine--tRNA ligase [Eubacteriales bacterium]|nr:histidine--tRNA ligase [Eubacteriales bacterium]
MTKINAPKGTRDILPTEIAAWQQAERQFAAVCARYGYQEIRIPTFESTDLFQRGVGDTTDVVQKEMYTFLDKGGRSISLRPEGTAGVVRSYLENGMASWSSPVRLWYNITAFRYENVQKGRYREFHQFGCEVFGADGPVVDAELISLLALFFKEIGLGQTSLRINSIGCPVCRTAYNQLLKAHIQPHLADMCPTCNDRFEKNPLRIIDCKEHKCQPVTKTAPALLDHLCPDCQTHFDGLCTNLDELGIAYTVDRGIVRGLDYYTRTVFEFISDHVGTQGTICGGGRYDGLIESIDGPHTPGIGFALGVERLMMELNSQGVSVATLPVPLIYIAGLGAAAATKARQITFLLRQQGIYAETDLMNRSLKAQMKFAGKTGATYTLVLGDDEIANGEAKLKHMADSTERVVRLDQLAAFLTAR